MEIVTWNVNSVRARLPRVLAWLEANTPDVLCLQELKCQDEDFPREEIEGLGYHIESHGQKTYNGVAILSRSTPDDVVRGMPGDDLAGQARVLAATVGGVRILNLYVVNGKDVGDPYYDIKLAWMQCLTNYLKTDFDMDDSVVVTGDFNITFDDRDIYDPDKWRGRIHCSEPERDALAALMAPGLTDAFRHFEEEGGHYTWWDYRTRGFQGDRGMRLDHFLISASALARCQGVRIDKEERGSERPSDHVPVVLTLK